MTPVQDTKRFNIYFYGSIVVAVWFAVVATDEHLAFPDPLVALRGLTAGSAVAYLLSIAIDRWLWRLPLLQRISGVLDISGRWEGWYWNTLGQKWLPNAHEIAQRSWHVSFHSWGPSNESSTISATLLTDGTGKMKLASIYSTEVISGASEPHMGASHLSLSRMGEETHLIGTYWTNRRRDDGTKGHYGYIRLTRTNKKTLGGISYDEKNWAMAKPIEPPEPIRN